MKSLGLLAIVRIEKFFVIGNSGELRTKEEKKSSTAAKLQFNEIQSKPKEEPIRNSKNEQRYKKTHRKKINDYF